MTGRPEIAKLEIRSLKGAPVHVTWSAGSDGVAYARAAVTVGAERIEDAFRCFLFVGSSPAFDALRPMGATHCAVVGKVVLALDAATALTIEKTQAEATHLARTMMIEAQAAETAEIRATKAVYHVLRHSPEWEGYALDEGYDASPGEFTRRVLLGLPGVVKDPIHQACPTIGTIRLRRSNAEFPGHRNQLWIITGAEVDALRAETTELNALDALKLKDAAAAEEARRAWLKAMEIPEEAITAFQRYDGDPDKAWRDEDERGAVLIRFFGEAIEEQGVAFARVDQAEMEINPPGAF